MDQLFAALIPVLKDLGINDTAIEALVFAAWKRTAGELLSERTAAVEFSGGRLTVAVEDLTWQRHLEELAPQLLARLNGRLGEGTVRFIEFRIDTLAIASRRPIKTKPSDSSYLIPNSIVEAAGKIGDPGLRESFLEAAAVSLANRTAHS